MSPTTDPTAEPSMRPTTDPTAEPSSMPTTDPTAEPSMAPTTDPTAEPSMRPTTDPTAEPSMPPTLNPTSQPTAEPTSNPTRQPTMEPTRQPSPEPSMNPTRQPSPEPTMTPTRQPTMSPTWACPAGFEATNSIMNARKAQGCDTPGATCCVALWQQGCTAECHQQMCSEAGGAWIAKDYSSNPYTCEISGPIPGAAPEARSARLLHDQRYARAIERLIRALDDEPQF